MLIVSLRGSNVDLMHVLFGTVLALDDHALFLLTAIAILTLFALALIYRALVIECFDPTFLRSVGRLGSIIHLLFLALVVLNLVGGFHALGTLMAVGLMMLPAAAARFWTSRLEPMLAIALLIAVIASTAGLLLSYHQGLPSGPAIILSAGAIWVISICSDPSTGCSPAGLPGAISKLDIKEGNPAMNRTGTLLAPIFGAFLAAAPAVSAEPNLQVIASFSILGDMANEIGGEHVSVTTLVGPDGDTHVYEPTPADVQALAKADLLIVNGLGFEGWLERLSTAASFKGITVVATNGITPLSLEEHHEEAEIHEDEEEHGHGHHHHGDKDPHAWHSLTNGAVYASNIEEGLSAADPSNAAVYRENGERYRAEITALDQETRLSLEALPEERRKIVTPHDAFGYFADSHDLIFLAPQGLSTESEASAADVAALIRQIRDERISAIFVENVADSRLIEQITRETDAVIGGTLYSDALSADDGPASTYLDMFRHNVGAITSALGS